MGKKEIFFIILCLGVIQINIQTGFSLETTKYYGKDFTIPNNKQGIAIDLLRSKQGIKQVLIPQKYNLLLNCSLIVIQYEFVADWFEVYGEKVGDYRVKSGDYYKRYTCEEAYYNSSTFPIYQRIKEEVLVDVILMDDSNNEFSRQLNYTEIKTTTQEPIDIFCKATRDINELLANEREGEIMRTIEYIYTGYSIGRKYLDVSKVFTKSVIQNLSFNISQTQEETIGTRVRGVFKTSLVYPYWHHTTDGFIDSNNDKIYDDFESTSEDFDWLIYTMDYYDSSTGSLVKRIEGYTDNWGKIINKWQNEDVRLAFEIEKYNDLEFVSEASSFSGYYFLGLLIVVYLTSLSRKRATKE